jgi:predicted NBD/HSP70 family sugar kinase
MPDLPKPKIVPPLDPGFRPAALLGRRASGTICTIGLQRPDGTGTRHAIRLADDPRRDSIAVERTVKFLLWQRGGTRITIDGPDEIVAHIKSAYSPGGSRAFDVGLIGRTVFEAEIEVVSGRVESIESARSVRSVGRHLEGCRIGFDLGASDRKVAAVIDGEEVFTEEKVWDPQGHSDPEYHYREIKDGIETAKRHLDRVDAIGGSSAGVIVDNRVMVASLFRSVPPEAYPRARDVFLRLREEYGVPFEVANDGDVTALAGAMSLNEDRVLGIAMGSSEAAGYVDSSGNITGWLNELAFAPIDLSPGGAVDEWSRDRGCGVQYLTQQAVFRLAPTVGIDIGSTDVLAEKLKIVQALLESGHEGARRIWETIGVYFGYAVAHYATFYDISRVLVLGRVTSGSGGPIIVENARRVAEAEGLDLVPVSLPDDKTRRVGQAVAAASLPAVRPS